MTLQLSLFYSLHAAPVSSARPLGCVDRVAVDPQLDDRVRIGVLGQALDRLDTRLKLQRVSGVLAAVALLVEGQVRLRRLLGVLELDRGCSRQGSSGSRPAAFVLNVDDPVA